MSKITAKQVSFESLGAKGKSAITVIKLMMLCNDLQLVNEALHQWKKEQPISKKHRQTGASMYFLRAQLSHLHEGMKVIQEIREDERLTALVKECDLQTQCSFIKLEEYLRESRDNKSGNIIAQIRHNITFHYNENGKQVKKAISERISSNSRISTITRGSHAYLWHFKVADDVIDSIVCRQIFDIQRTANLREEADKIAEKCHAVFLSFMDFSGEFIWRFHS